MVNLIEDILDYSRMQFSKFEQNLSWFTICDIVNEVYDIVDFQATDRHVSLEKDIKRIH
jgi:signal transduction histidine kinase